MGEFHVHEVYFKMTIRGASLAQSVEPVTLYLGVMSSAASLGTEFALKKKKENHLKRIKKNKTYNVSRLSL